MRGGELLQPVTILGLGLCFAVLYFRYRASAAKSQPRNTKQILKTAKLLFAALLAWMAISLELRRLDHSLTHSSPYELSMWDRIVQTLSK